MWVLSLQHQSNHMADHDALQLRDIWLDLTAQSTRKDGRVRVDAFTWMNKVRYSFYQQTLIVPSDTSIQVTLDIIGLAGFDHDFDSLHRPEDDQDELYRAFSDAVNAKRSPFLFLQLAIPVLRHLVRVFLLCQFMSSRLSACAAFRAGSRTQARDRHHPREGHATDASEETCRSRCIQRRSYGEGGLRE